MTQIYIDSWNQGFGHLLGRRTLTAERVERMRIDIAQRSSDWSVAGVDGHVVGFILWTPAGYDRGHSFYLATGWHPLGISRADDTEIAFWRRT